MTENIHTKHHNVDSTTGRSKEIEGYIEKSFHHALDRHYSRTAQQDLPLGSSRTPNLFMDMGCHYGYAMSLAKMFHSEVTGVELYVPDNTPKEIKDRIYEGQMDGPDREVADWLDGGIGQPDMVFMNHSLEHCTNPKAALRNAFNVMDSNGGTLFVAVPHLGYDWAYWAGHKTLWDERQLRRFITDVGFEDVKVELRCFRGTNVEIWATAVKKG